MQEKELIKKLNKLGSIKADQAWKKLDREALMNHVFDSGTGLNEVWSGLSKKWLPLRVLSGISQPVMAAILIGIFLVGSGAAGVLASRDSKPGDSLYIAKKISEKAQLIITFDEEKKLKLGLEFAGNRASELSQVLADTKDEAKAENAERLVKDFRKEIDAAKSRIAKITGKSPIEEEPKDIPSEDAEAPVFSANISREETGVQIALPDEETAETGSEPAIPTEEAEASAAAVPTTTPASAAAVPTTTPALEGETIEEAASQDPQAILKEAGEFLDKQDYDSTISKLDEAGEVIELINSPQVKGMSEAATSSPEQDEGQIPGVEEEVNIIINN